MDNINKIMDFIKENPIVCCVIVLLVCFVLYELVDMCKVFNLPKKVEKMALNFDDDEDDDEDENVGPLPFCPGAKKGKKAKNNKKVTTAETVAEEISPEAAEEMAIRKFLAEEEATRRANVEEEMGEKKANAEEVVADEALPEEAPIKARRSAMEEAAMEEALPEEAPIKARRSAMEEAAMEEAAMEEAAMEEAVVDETLPEEAPRKVRRRAIRRDRAEEALVVIEEEEMAEENLPVTEETHRRARKRAIRKARAEEALAEIEDEEIAEAVTDESTVVVIDAPEEVIAYMSDEQEQEDDEELAEEDDEELAEEDDEELAEEGAYEEVVELDAEMSYEENMLCRQQQIKSRSKAEMIRNLKTSPMHPLRNKKRNRPALPTSSHLNSVLPPVPLAKKSNKKPCFCEEDGPYTAGAKTPISRQISPTYDQDNIVQRTQDWAGITGYSLNMPYASADAFEEQFKIKKVKQ